MKITLTENSLRNMVRDIINEAIDYPPFIKDMWKKEKYYHIKKVDITDKTN